MQTEQTKVFEDIDGELSDLFFNIQKDNYDKLPFGEMEVSEEEMRKALILDATDFKHSYPDTHSYFDAPHPEDMAEDFLRRI